MPPSHAQHVAATEEIYLFELVNLLAQRRAWIAGIMAAFAAGGIMYAVLTPPVYEAAVRLRIGQVESLGLLEPAEELSSRLLADHGREVAAGVERSHPFLKQATAPRGVNFMIELVAEGETPEDAVQLLTRVVDEVRTSHDAIFKKTTDPLTERLESLSRARTEMRQQYENAAALLDRLKLHDPVQASLVMLELSHLSTSIRELDAERPALAQRLSPPQTRPTSILGEIALPATPSAPQKTAILALSALLGLVVAMAAVVVVEIVSRARRSRSASPARR